MKFKGFWYDGLLISLAAAVSAVFIAMTVFVEPRLAIAEGIAFLIVCVIAVTELCLQKTDISVSLPKHQRSLILPIRRCCQIIRFPLLYATKTAT